MKKNIKFTTIILYLLIISSLLLVACKEKNDSTIATANKKECSTAVWNDWCRHRSAYLRMSTRICRTSEHEESFVPMQFPLFFKLKETYTSFKIVYI